MSEWRLGQEYANTDTSTNLLCSYTFDYMAVTQAVPPSMPSITGLPLFCSKASSSAGVKFAGAGPPPVPAMSFIFLAAAIEHHEIGQILHKADYPKMLGI